MQHGPGASGQPPAPGHRGRVARSQRGAVTAEAAVVLPVLVAVSWAMVWLLAVGVAQLRVVDAARETARALARQESPAVATAAGARVAPPGARITVRQEGDRVVARVAAEVRGPGGLWAFLPGLEVDAEAVAAREPG